MKVTSEILEKPFEPFKLILTIETKKEFNFIHYLFNDSDLSSVFNDYANVNSYNILDYLGGREDAEHFEIINEMLLKRIKRRYRLFNK
jgi:hypothetical protein